MPYRKNKTLGGEEKVFTPALFNQWKFQWKDVWKSRSYTLVSSVCNPALAGTNYTDKVDLNDGENISSVFTSSISGKK